MLRLVICLAVFAAACNATLRTVTETAVTGAELIKGCPAGSVMYKCDCDPYSGCDGAEMVGGQCKVKKRSSGKGASKIKLRLGCLEVMKYVQSKEFGKEAACPAGTFREDCTLYKANRGDNDSAGKNCKPSGTCGKACVINAACRITTLT